MYEFLGGMFHNPYMLFALAALAIPIIIHLLSRRRYDVVDWGAMQFLQFSEVTRRRIFIEELLLLLLRMGLIALLVLGLALPYFTSPALGRMAPRVNRDVVLIFDGSYSMGSLDSQGKTPHDAAKEWALGYLDDLAAGDTVAILQGKEAVLPVLAEATHDLQRAREAVAKLPPPSGGCDWRTAVKAAHEVLAASKRAEREIVLLSDGQLYGWADPESLFRWELLAGELGYNHEQPQGTAPRPRLWVVNLAEKRRADSPSWALAPLDTNRPVVPIEREVTFRTALDIRNQPGGYAKPHRISLEVDGKWVRDLLPPESAQLQEGNRRVPFEFRHRFAAAGSHLVSVTLQPDLPAAERPKGYQLRDVLPGDNRQDFSLEVIQALPVLLVDGDPPGQTHHRGSDFLRDALAPARDRTPVVNARVIGASEFDPALLAAPAKPMDGAAPRPRVVVLCNVPRLNEQQQEALTQFIADGGGVLVTLGERADPDFYNAVHKGGKGWLPAALDGIAGSEARPKDAVRPAPGVTDHPALQLFLEKANREGEPPRFPQLGQARFPRWWKLKQPQRNSAGVAVAFLRNASEEYPFLIEWVDPNRAGRVVMAPVPFDNSWGTNLPHLPAFVPLVHELIYYLAGTRSAEFNLEPGQSLRYRLSGGDSLTGFTLAPPGGEPRPLSTDPTDRNTFLAVIDRLPQATILRHDGLRETGVWRLQTPEEVVVPYVVRTKKADESDLTPAKEEDRQKVAKFFPNMKYQNDRSEMAAEWISESHKQETWWWLLLGLIGLLCMEVWMTRRIVLQR
jgi:hypothetical protein